MKLALLVLAAVASAQIPNWVKQSPQTNPTTRAYGSLVYDSAHSQVVLFGGLGINPSIPFNDTWVWDGVTWTQKFPKTSPPARFAHAMAYDSVRHQVVLFGGEGNTANFGDTWVWDGTNWTQMSPNTSPPNRDYHAMVFDSAHSQVVLFGGSAGASSANDFNDTWTWDGSNWTQQQPTSLLPPIRVEAAMAYDSLHQQTVLFGGQGVSNKPLGDTWIWDGTNWTQKNPQASPSARDRASLAYDSGRGQTVLFGGNDLNATTNDTWTWDGTNWTQQSPQTSPPQAIGSGMAYDSGHAQEVIFGGVGQLLVVSDTWTYGLPVSTPGGCTNSTPPVITSIDSASSYGGYSYFASGSWLEIKGTNLAPATAQWTLADFNGVNAPTQLQGISVSINGKPAYVWYLSTGQLNVQAPEDSATGNVAITVTNCKATSNPIMFARQALAPGFLNYTANGTPYMVATFASDGAYVLNTATGAALGLTSRPAKPGDIIVAYGIGFGDVTPSFLPGVTVGAANALVNPITFSFGGTPATLAYQGLAATFVGLYEFYITVPALANGDYVITATQNGNRIPQSLSLTIHN